MRRGNMRTGAVVLLLVCGLVSTVDTCAWWWCSRSLVIAVLFGLGSDLAADWIPAMNHFPLNS